jgi:hypothetical protein
VWRLRVAKGAVFELPFAGGIDQSQRSEAMDPRAAFVALENVRQPTVGGATKRYGFSAQTLARPDSSRLAGYKLFSYGKQTCVIDGSTLDAYSTAASCSINFGRLPECTLETMGLSGVSTTAPVDMAMCGNYIVTAHRAGGASGFADIYVTVLDAQTGIVVRPAEQLYTATSVGFCRLAVYGTRVFAFFGDLDAGVTTITYRILNVSSAANFALGWSVSANAATDAVETTSFCVCSLDNKVALSYPNNSGGASQLTVKTLDSSGVLQTQTIATSSVRPYATSIFGETGDTLWVAWNETTAVKVRGLDPADITLTALATTLTVLSTPVALTDGQTLPIDVISHPSTAGAGRLFVNESTAIRMKSFTTSGGAVTVSPAAATPVYNAIRAGRSFRYGSRYYALVGGWGGTQFAVVCDMTEDATYLRPVAALPMAVSSWYQAAQAWVSGTDAFIPYATLTSAETGTGYSLYGLRVAKLGFANTQRWQTAAHAGRVAIGGGVLCTYDGGDVAEAGFLVRPRAPTTVDAGSGSGPNGAYRYVVVYESVDTTGTRHFSSVSDPSASLTVADNTITVTVRPLSVSYRINAVTDPSVRISIYRTEAGGEPPYYYLTSIDNALTGATLTYSDSTPDTTLTTREKLYAPSLPGVNGSAQDRRPPPGLTHIVSYNGMLVGSQGEDLYYSGQDVSGEGTWFSPIFQVPVSGDGPITGLAVQDGSLFIFKRTGIYAVSGEPPSDNGAAGGLGTPRKLAVDVGCIDARSIVVTGVGVLFQSERSIEIMTRAQSVVQIGDKIQDELAARPYVVSAKLDATQGLVYFELASAETANQVSGTGRGLVLDLTIPGPDGMPRWVSADRRKNTAGTADTPAQDGCVVWNGSAYRYAWLGTDARVYIEDRSTHLDPNSAWVTQYAKTSWIHVAGMQGHQIIDRVLVLADQSTDHDITVGVAHDYDDSTFVDKDWDSDALDALTTMWLDRDLTQDQGQALMVELTDATPTGTANTVGTGKGGTWVALAFSGEPKVGVKRTAYTQRGGTE